MKRAPWFVLPLLAGMISGCHPDVNQSQSLPTTAAVPAYVPMFTPTTCAFEIPQGYTPTCGTVSVPENRNNPNGRFVRLAVAVFKSPSPSPKPEAVIQLVGGPGASALANAELILQRGGGKILKQQDFILFDQRGVGASYPSLFCQPYDEYLWQAREQNLSLEEYYRGALTSLETCLEDWHTQGMDLSAYNTTESAADIADLRLALGYDQVNLYGISYGTRLALEVMRDHPEGIRSVILDSVFPPQANLDLELAASAERALELLFSGCAGVETCTREHGDLRNEFYSVIDRLEAEPVELEVSGPYQSTPYHVYLDGDLFIDLVFGGLYSPASLVDLPGIIQAAYDERFSGLAELAGGAIGSPLSTGLFWSTTCREELPFETNVFPSTKAENSRLSNHFSIETVMETCRLWNIPPADLIQNKAVSSAIPTLLLAGLHDPVTPPNYAEAAAASLSRHYYYLFPNMAHGVMRSDPCALQIGMDFLADPLKEPDHSCMQVLTDIEFH